MKSILALFMFVAVGFGVKAQIPQADFAKGDVYWYGLDFSKAKLIGSAGFTNPEDIRNQFFDKWNGLVMEEADKYDVKGAFRKPTMKYDLEVVKNLNKNADYTKLVIDKPYSLTREDVEKQVKNYKLEQKEGYGVIFVVESLDKLSEKAKVWAAVFDIKTRKVYVSEHLEGEAGGFGLRNYWGAGINKIIAEIKKTKFKSWAR